MAFNKQWHEENPMLKNPTLTQRIEWHTKHAKHCACRPIPQKLLDVMKKKK